MSQAAAIVLGILPPTTLAHPCAAEYLREFLTQIQHLSPSRYGSIAVFRIIIDAQKKVCTLLGLLTDEMPGGTS